MSRILPAPASAVQPRPTPDGPPPSVLLWGEDTPIGTAMTTSPASLVAMPFGDTAAFAAAIAALPPSVVLLCPPVHDAAELPGSITRLLATISTGTTVVVALPAPDRSDALALIAARGAATAVVRSFGEQGDVPCALALVPTPTGAVPANVLTLAGQLAERRIAFGSTITLSSDTGGAWDTRWSVSAIIGCYNENPAIPAMYERLKAVFTKLGVDHEIIFINNDNRPGTDAEHLVAELSAKDPCVIGINMSRNYQSQAGFMSGLQLATKNACVLLDGDLQDPPELIEQFVEKWKEGYQVVYGRRVKREATPFMQFAFKAFYRLWDALSYIRVPRDAGDFSLIDRVAVEAILSCPERDLWLRGIRAFVGFQQTGVDYERPERPWGKSSNNMLRNLHWARKGIFSFSNTPLTVLTYAGFVLLVVGVLLIAVQVVWKLLDPQAAPWGFATLLTAILFFGSVNLFACGILGEYIGRIFEEVKGRPLYVLRSITRYGVSHPVPAEENVPRQRLTQSRIPSFLPMIQNENLPR